MNQLQQSALDTNLGCNEKPNEFMNESWSQWIHTNSPGSKGSRHKELHTHVILSSRDGDLSHLSLCKAASASAACTGLQMNNDAKYGFFFLCLSLQPCAASATHTSQPPTEWGARRELPTERVCFPEACVLFSFLPLPSVLTSDFRILVICCYFSRVFGLSSCVGL